MEDTRDYNEDYHPSFLTALSCRKLDEIINFEDLFTPFQNLYSTTGAEGIDVVKGLKALLIQFWEDYSDRQMEKALKENVAIKWFCGFKLTEETPTYSYFSKLRDRIGTKNIADIFKQVNIQGPYKPFKTMIH